MDLKPSGRWSEGMVRFARKLTTAQVGGRGSVRLLIPCGAFSPAFGCESVEALGCCECIQEAVVQACGHVGGHVGG